MAECQSGRVKRLPRSCAFEEFGGSAGGAGDPPATPAGVDRIAHDRVAKMLQMDSDLVSPSGVELQPEQVDNLEPRGHGGISAGRATPAGDGHPLPVARVPRDWRVDAHFSGGQMTPCQGGIGPAYPARGDGGAEPSVGQISLGDDHEA